MAIDDLLLQLRVQEIEDELKKRGIDVNSKPSKTGTDQNQWQMYANLKPAGEYALSHPALGNGWERHAHLPLAIARQPNLVWAVTQGGQYWTLSRWLREEA